MFDALKDLFKPPVPKAYAQRELLEAELELLKAQTGLEYAQAMVTYRETQVKRLRGATKETS